MNKVLCFIQDSFGSVLALYIGRDSKGYAYWEFLGGGYPYNKFATKKGDWWYSPSTGDLDIYSSDGKTNSLEFRLVGVPHNFLPPNCGPDATGKGLRFPNENVEYRIGGSGTCQRPAPKKPRKGR